MWEGEEGCGREGVREGEKGCGRDEGGREGVWEVGEGGVGCTVSSGLIFMASLPITHCKCMKAR